MSVLFLDFDGVVIDSIEECFNVSYQVYYGFRDPVYDHAEIKKIFYEYRGLVRPAYQYLVLHQLIEDRLSGTVMDIAEKFQQQDSDLVQQDISRFESQFFGLRKFYQKDKEKWLSYNPLTEYGRSLIGKNMQHTYILTTKNIESVNLVLDKYGIAVAGIYDKESYVRFGNKGRLIREFLDKNKCYSKAIFVDDAVEHLDTANDKRVGCYFADWGYGINTSYKVFAKEMWQAGM